MTFKFRLFATAAAAALTAGMIMAPAVHAQNYAFTNHSQIPL